MKKYLINPLTILLSAILIIAQFGPFNAAAQKPDSLNTAKKYRYMTSDEREMICEINCV